VRACCAAPRDSIPGGCRDGQEQRNAVRLTGQARDRVRMKTAKAAILVVDDQEANRDILSRRLQRDGFDAYCAADGEEALTLVRQRGFDLILLDIMMPKLNGYEVLERLQEHPNLRHIPVVVISALEELDSAVRCIELGAVDYLPKPCNPVLLRARVASSIAKKRAHDSEERHRDQLHMLNAQLEQRVSEQVTQITAGQLTTIFAMSKLAESKDPETGAHLDRLREYCKLVATHLARVDGYRDQIDEGFIDTIYAASPLHDIGKVGVPDDILLKPGKLTEEEWRVMKTHTTIGAETLRAVDREHPGSAFVRMGIEIAEGHHERWDGSGYPYGVQGISIPLSARILALADVYDALTSVRCYKRAFSHGESRAIILEGRATHFDPGVVDAFLETEAEFVRIREYFQDPSEQFETDARLVKQGT